MRILAGIPTYHRQTAPALAKRFSEFSDVVIVSADTKLPQSEFYEILETEKGLANQRNTIFQYAIGGGYDAVVQCDDDIGFKPGVLEQFFWHINELLPKGIASVSSKPRQFEFWDGPCRSNKTYEIIPRLFQCWALRVEVAKKLGFMDLDTGEDIDYTWRIVQHRLAPAQISIKGITHDHLVPRLKKGENAGGQSTAERQALLDHVVATINSRYDFIKMTRKGESSQSVKLDWKEFVRRVPNLGLGYEDKRGIRV